MSIKQLVGGVAFPTLPQYPSSGSPGTSGVGLDASTEKGFYTFLAPKSGTIEAFEFYMATVSPFQCTNGLKISFQTMSGGNPSGTVLAYRVITSGLGSATWVAPAIMTDDGTDTGVPLTVASGDRICAVIEFASFASGDKVGFHRGITCTPYSNVYCGQDTTGSWAKNTTASPTVILRYSDGTYPAIVGAFTVGAFLSQEYKSTTTIEAGMYFTMPAPVRIRGILAHTGIAGAVEARMYRWGDNTPVSSYSLDSANLKAGSGFGVAYFPFNSDVYVDANEPMAAMLRAGSSSSSLLLCYTVPNVAYLDFAECGPWHLLTRDASTESWTAVTDSRPFLSLVITGIDHEIGGQPSLGFEGTA